MQPIIHPAARSAFAFVTNMPLDVKNNWLEAFKSQADDGHEDAAAYAKTLESLLNADEVSDREVLGLAWALREMMPTLEWSQYRMQVDLLLDAAYDVTRAFGNHDITASVTRLRQTADITTEVLRAWR